MSTTTEEKWHIRLASGDVRTGTLEQLDEAFQSGSIDERTLVMPENGTQWPTLGALLGLEPAQAAAPPPAVASAPPPAPPSAPPPPVVADLADMDLTPPAFKSSSGKVVAALAAAAVVGAIAIAVAVLGATRTAGPATGVAAAAGAALPASGANAAMNDALPATDPDGHPRLTEAQKKELLDADKEREQRAAERRAKIAPAPRRHSGNPFHKGGNVYDPLNAKL